MEREVRTPPPAQLSCFHICVSPVNRELSATFLCHRSAFFIRFSIYTRFPSLVAHFHRIQKCETPSHFEPRHSSWCHQDEFFSSCTEKAKYWVNRGAAWVPNVFVIVEHGHPHQSSVIPFISTLHIPRQQRTSGLRSSLSRAQHT